MAEQPEQRASGQFQYKHFPEFTGGIRRDLRSDTLPDNALIDCHNVSIRKGKLETDKGYAQFMGSVRGTPQHIQNIQYSNGTTDMVLFTTDTIYERRSGQWVYAINRTSAGSGDQYDTVRAEAAFQAKSVTISKAVAETLRAGDYVGVMCKTQDPKDVVSVSVDTPDASHTTYKLLQADAEHFNVGDVARMSGNVEAQFNVDQAVTATTRIGGVATVDTITDQNDHANNEGYTSVSLTGGTGSGAVATVVVSGNNVTSVTITTAGTGYAVGDTLTIPHSTIQGTGPVECAVKTLDSTTHSNIVTSFDSTGLTSSGSPKLELFAPASQHTSQVLHSYDHTDTSSDTTISGVVCRPVPLNDEFAGVKSGITYVAHGVLIGRAVVGAGFVRAPTLNGVVDGAVTTDSVFVPDWGSDTLTGATKSGVTVFTNGVDPPKVVFAGTGGITVRDFVLTKITQTPFNNGSTALVGGVFVAKTVSHFSGKLIFGNTIEGTATPFVNRLRLSKLYKYENFYADEGGEVVDLVDGNTGIVAVQPMAEFIIVYKGDIIYRGDWIGSPSLSIRFASTIHTEGLIATNAVVPRPGFHYFVGNRNIYKYNGGRELEAIADPIREVLFESGRTFTISNKHQVFATFDDELKEFTVFYPEGINVGCRKAFRYYETYKAWSSRTFSNWFINGTCTPAYTTLTWAQLTQRWTDYTQPWSTAFFTADKTHRLLLATGKSFYITFYETLVVDGDKYVFDQNHVKDTDNGVRIYWELETKDFYLPDSFIRVDFLDLYCAGDAINVHYSNDIGKSYKRVKQTVPRDDIEAERVHMNFTAKQLRFRLRGNVSNFQLGWAGLSFIPEFTW